MNTITASKARANLYRLIDQTVESHEANGVTSSESIASKTGNPGLGLDGESEKGGGRGIAQASNQKCDDAEKKAYTAKRALTSGSTLDIVRSAGLG